VKVAVTGASGFLGWHLRCALHAEGFEEVAVTRADFTDPAVLRSRLCGVDAIIHAAGANRGSDNAVEQTNMSLASALVDATSGAVSPRIVYLNSTHRDRSTPYGRSKAAAARLLADSRADDGFLDLILPGVFGERGRPNYNSVVSTFCHQLARNETLSVNDDTEIELLHAQDVADVVIDALRARTSGEQRLAGHALRVTELALLLRSFHDSYSAGVVPQIGQPFERAMFNTMRSYRFPDLYPFALTPRSDQRGRLVELIKADTGGQMFISTTLPGVTRGDHYHRRKVERFVVVEGSATVSLRRLFDDDVVSFEVSGDDPVAIDMPTMHTHNITNSGTSLLVTAFWSDEIFDPDHSDTYWSKVER
jgi:UDP-2-acetamido-2,6-beta-L-arabino-hexul-4-ose reductase